jgi:peptide/nickel transport system permease protein
VLTYILKRLAFGLSLIFVVTSLTFFLVYGDPAVIARNMLGADATEQQIHDRVVAMGLDRPLIEQYGEWLGNALHGDLGTSFITSQSVGSSLATHVPVTLSIVLCGVLVTGLIAVVLGMTAAVRRGWVDRVVQVVSVVGISLPNFWTALMLVLMFAVTWQVLPATGYVSPDRSLGAWAASITLPVVALALSGIAAATQQVRGAAIDILEADFVRTLRSRGLTSRSILFRHVLKNAAPPALTVLSLQFIGLLGGAIVIEKVFALPGMGTMAVGAVLNSDVPTLLGVVTVTVVLVVLVNLIIDLVNGWVNPKVRLS